MNTLLFAYADDTNFNVMLEHCPDAHFVGTATLRGHELIFRGVADYTPSRGHDLKGALWLMTECELLSLKQKDYTPGIYTADTVSVIRDNGESVEAQAFNARHCFSIHSPSKTYRDQIVQGYIDCGIPLQQLNDAIRKCKKEFTPDGIRDIEPSQKRA